MGHTFSIFCPGMIPLDVLAEFSTSKGGATLLKKSVHGDSSRHRQEMSRRENVFCDVDDELCETESRVSDDVQLLSESFTDDGALQHLLPPQPKERTGEERVSCSPPRIRNSVKTEHVSICSGHCPAKKPTSGIGFQNIGAIDRCASEAVFETARSKRPTQILNASSVSKHSSVSESVNAHPKARSSLCYRALLDQSDSLDFNNSICSEWSDKTDSTFYNPTTACPTDSAVINRNVQACDKLPVVFNLAIDEAPSEKNCYPLDEIDNEGPPSTCCKNHVNKVSRDLTIWPDEGYECGNSDMVGGNETQSTSNTTSDHQNICSTTTCCKDHILNCQTKTSNAEQDHIKVILPNLSLLQSC